MANKGIAKQMEVYPSSGKLYPQLGIAYKKNA